MKNDNSRTAGRQEWLQAPGLWRSSNWEGQCLYAGRGLAKASAPDFECPAALASRAPVEKRATLTWGEGNMTKSACKFACRGLCGMQRSQSGCA